MRRIAVILFCWLFLTGLLPAQQAFVCEGQFFLTLTNDAQSGLVEVGIDPDDLSVTFDPLFPALGDYINAIGYSSTEHLIYGVNMTTQELIRIDGVGQVTVLADLPMNSNYLYPAGDISPDGRYLWISGGTGAALTGKDKELIRVDLATPGYPATVFPIGGVEVRMLDLAFDPLTGILYGFDAYQARLVVIDPTTAVVSTPFPSAWGVTSTVGSLFFDAFGRLFGYGNDGMGTQNTLFFIDKLTGQVVPQGIGPAASNTDACSCPYTVALSKAAMPRQVYPCEEIRYTYYLANGAGYDQQGLRLRDTFPAGFEVVEIVHQPPGGSWQSSLGTELVDLVDFSLHPGIDSLVLQVRVPPGAEGAYPTQAHLTGLPPVLGLERFSDDPLTFRPADSTVVWVNRPRLDTLTVDLYACAGDTVRLSPPRLGDDYRWEDGSTEGYRLVTEPGDYRLRVLAGCDTSWVHYRLTISYVTVKLPRDGYTVPWGETVELRPTFFSDGAVEDLHWEPGGLACDNCPSPEVAPLQSTIYTLYATNEYGCLDSASVEVRVPVDRRIYLPTAFSPNGDGTNDFFYAQGPTLARIAYFYVFDRWGGQVFALENGAIDDPAFGWDGQTNGRPAPPGVYGWALGLVFPDNEVVERSGEIILLR